MSIDLRQLALELYQVTIDLGKVKAKVLDADMSIYKQFEDLGKLDVAYKTIEAVADSIAEVANAREKKDVSA